MMHKLKIKDALLLLKAKVYVLITRESTSLFGDFTGVGEDMKLHALKEARDELNRQIKLVEKANKANKKSK